MVMETPKPVTKAVGIEKRTEGDATKAMMPIEKIKSPIQAVLVLPSGERCEGLQARQRQMPNQWKFREVLQ